MQVKLGGVNLNNAGYLASALKSKVAELELQQRIEPSAKDLLSAQYTDNLASLAPNVAEDAIQTRNGILNIGLRSRKGKITNSVVSGNNENGIRTTELNSLLQNTSY